MTSLLTIALLLVGPCSQPLCESGIIIHATLGPTCPVERAGGPPCVRPYLTKIRIARDDGSASTSAATDARGLARICLAPGSYVVTAESSSSLPFPRKPQPARVTVTNHTFASVALQFDTGIR